MRVSQLFLLFSMVPLFVAMTGENLRYRGVRVVLFCLFVPMIAALWVGAVAEADWTPAGIASAAGISFCGGLSLLGLCDISRFFWAFRVLCAGIFLQLLITALVASTVGFAAQRGGTAPEDWILFILIGLPCLWFARKGRLRPTNQRMHVIVKQNRIPSLDVWQQAVRRWGFDLVLQGPEDITQIASRLDVRFRGAETGFQFDVCSLQEIAEKYELDAGTAERLGEEFVAANFRYGDAQEETAALVAAAALAKAADAQFYSPDHDAWWDGDDAIEAAQDVVQPLELHVLLSHERIPTRDQWRLALVVAGIELEPSGPDHLGDHVGFLAVRCRGTKTGFSFSLSLADFVVGGDHFPASEAPPETFRMTDSANFRFARGDAEHAAAVAAAVFARIGEGIVFDPRRGSFSSGDAALEAAWNVDHSDEEDDR